jgi:hypothetical protein
MVLLLPEFFAFLGVDIFVAMSLLTCLFDEHFPKTLPYVFQAAAVGGYVHILISRGSFVAFGDFMRFWYCFLYMAVGLASLIALNVYLAMVKKRWTVAKVFSGAVVFPAIFISTYFVSVYAFQVAQFYIFQMAVLLGSTSILLLSAVVFLSPRITNRFWERR